ncbi:MAG: hypothetical protein GVY24_01615 [Planctomycetes bacterium]|jgi:hypothetical protein|nr:hypothetical protein [Planctomycetota bacterium]
MQTRRRDSGSPRGWLAVVTLGLSLGWVGPAPAQQVTPQRMQNQQPSNRVTPQRLKEPAPAPPSTRRDASESRGPSEASLIGLTEAHQRWGKDTPLGRGVVLGHVEGNPGQYTPNLRSERYHQIDFVPRSGESEPFGHAEGVAKQLYGRGGLAPGISEVHNFASSDWLGDGLLNGGTGHAPKLDDRPRLYTHSWISTLTGKAGADVLRRTDYLIDTADVLMCVGVNNGRDTAVPPLMGSAYNVIAVGALNGNSSGGYTRFEGKGRCKPDVVAPGGLTSFATPVAAAVVARLLEAADQMADTPEGPRVDEARIQHVDDQAGSESGGNSGGDSGGGQAIDASPERFGARHPAARSELIKAVLMAGAIKPEGWAREPGKPLDEHLGAGMVRLDRSLAILRGGQAKPGTVRQRYGWDFGQAGADQTVGYTFDVRQSLGPASIMLVWNRRIDGRTIIAMPKGATRPIKGWVHAPRLADFDLRLLEINDAGEAVEMQLSASALDNVEHLYLPVLVPGRYRLEVIRRSDDAPDAFWDYALAWRVEDQVQMMPPVPEALRPASAEQTTDPDAEARP